MNESIILYASVSIIILILLFISYTAWRTKRMLKEAIENENKDY